MWPRESYQVEKNYVAAFSLIGGNRINTGVKMGRGKLILWYLITH